MKKKHRIKTKKIILLIVSIIIIIGILFYPMAASAEVDMGWLNDFFGIFNQAIENLSNFLGNAFSGLFDAIQSWLNPVLQWFGDKLHDIGQALESIVDSVTGTIQNFWDAIKQFFSTIFKPVLDFIYGFLYLIRQVFEIVKLIIKLIAHIFQLIIAIAGGFINTISSLTNWSQSNQYFTVPNSYTQSYMFVMDFLGSSGLNIVAGIAAVGVWVITAHAVIRLASGGTR